MRGVPEKVFSARRADRGRERFLGERGSGHFVHRMRSSLASQF